MPIKINNPKENSNIIDIDFPKNDTIIFRFIKKKHAEQLNGDMVALKKIYAISREAEFKHSFEAKELSIKIEGNLDHIQGFLKYSGLLSEDSCQKLAEEIKNNNKVIIAQTAPNLNVPPNFGIGLFSNSSRSLSTTDISRESLSIAENNLALQIEQEIIQKLANVSQPVKDKVLSDLIKICTPMQALK